MTQKILLNLFVVRNVINIETDNTHLNYKFIKFKV